jgi:hypothetical protein
LPAATATASSATVLVLTPKQTSTQNGSAKKVQRTDSKDTVTGNSSPSTSDDEKDEVKVGEVVPGDDAKALHEEELGKPKEKFRNYVDSAQQEVTTFLCIIDVSIMVSQLIDAWYSCDSVLANSIPSNIARCHLMWFNAWKPNTMPLIK